MITVSPELLATMRMLPRLLAIAAVSAAFVMPAASFVRKAEQAVKKSDAGATPLSPAQKLLQPVQLAAAVGLLVELPCCACGRPAPRTGVTATLLVRATRVSRWYVGKT